MSDDYTQDLLDALTDLAGVLSVQGRHADCNTCTRAAIHIAGATSSSEAEQGANAPAAEPTLATLEKQLAQAEFEKQSYTDALRYRKLRELYHAVDFSYGTGYEKGEPVLIFRWPVGMRVSANLDATLDAAMSASNDTEEKGDA